VPRDLEFWEGDRQVMRRSELAIVGLLAVAYVPAFLTLARVWSSVDYYSHGFLVPVVAYWMFRKSADGLGTPGRDPRGALILGISTLVYALGLIQGAASMQGLAVVIAAAGLATLFWGVRGLRRFAFPVAFLLFMIPLPPSILTPVIVWLQLKVTVASVSLLQAIGYTVLREGNVVLLPGGGSLFVAEACSGITSVVTLLPLGVVLAYFRAPSRLHGLAFIAAVIPVAMIGNLVRVVVTVLAANHFGVERATAGPLHESAGLLTFILECFVLIGLVPLMRLIPIGRRGGPRAAPPA